MVIIAMQLCYADLCFVENDGGDTQSSQVMDSEYENMAESYVWNWHYRFFFMSFVAVLFFPIGSKRGLYRTNWKKENWFLIFFPINYGIEPPMARTKTVFCSILRF